MYVFMKRYWILIASPCPKLTSFTATLCRTNSNSMCNVSIIRSSKSESWCSASPSSVLGLFTLEGWMKDGNTHKGNMPALKIQIFRFVLLSYSSKSASQPVCQLVRQWVLLRLYWGVPQFMFSIKSTVFCTLTQRTKPWGQVDQKKTNIHPRFLRHNVNWSLPTPLGPSQVTSLVYRQDSFTIHRYPCILLAGKRQSESKVSCPRTQHNDLVKLQAQPPDPGPLTAH